MGVRDNLTSVYLDLDTIVSRLVEYDCDDSSWLLLREIQRVKEDLSKIMKTLDDDFELNMEEI